MEMTLLFFMYPGCCHRKFLGAKRFLALVIYYTLAVAVASVVHPVLNGGGAK